jgi:hypothetical protein
MAVAVAAIGSVALISNFILNLIFSFSFSFNFNFVLSVGLNVVLNYNSRLRNSIQACQDAHCPKTGLHFRLSPSLYLESTDMKSVCQCSQSLPSHSISPR